MYIHTLLGGGKPISSDHNYNKKYFTPSNSLLVPPRSRASHKDKTAHSSSELNWYQVMYI